MSSWNVPAELVERMTMLGQAAWVRTLPGVAAVAAHRWRLTADGAGRSGYWSAVWPVRDASGRALVLKLARPGDGREHEAAALCAWGGRGVVRLHAYDGDLSALLLQRLDATRSLGSEADIDQATAVIGNLLAGLLGVPAPEGVLDLATVAERLAADLHAADPGPVRRARVERALGTLDELRVWATLQPLSLLHNDLHYLNVLRSLPAGEEGAWFVIDPLPLAGVPEWEVVALLRNRWSDALATGAPDRALRRGRSWSTSAMSPTIRSHRPTAS